MNLYNSQPQAAAIFSMWLPDHIEHYPQLRVLTADMSRGLMDRIKAFYPDQYLNVGIAEQNLIGVAAGMAAEGFTPICEAQAAFITMRSFEQVRQYMSYQQHPIILVGIGSGFNLPFMGNTHYAVEDIALMRAIPNIDILCPADSVEAVAAIEYAIEHRRPTYIRLHNQLFDLFEDLPAYQPQQLTPMSEGSDLAIISTGSMTAVAKQAAEQLAERGIAAAHYHAPLLRQDGPDILLPRDVRCIVSLEEHYTIGGLGSLIGQQLIAQGRPTPLLTLGIQSHYTVVGSYPYLLALHRLRPDQIADDITEWYRNISQTSVK